MDPQNPSAPKKGQYETPRLRRVFAAGSRTPITPEGRFYWSLATALITVHTEELRQQQDGGK